MKVCESSPKNSLIESNIYYDKNKHLGRKATSYEVSNFNLMSSQQGEQGGAQNYF